MYITGVGLRKEAPASIETIRSVKTVIKAEELALAAASMALRQAGLDNLENSAVVFGIDNAIDGCKAEFFKGLLQDGPIGASPLLFPYTSSNAITAQVTIAFGIKGEDITITGGALSFLKAICYGLELLNRGVIQSAIIGGVSENEAMALVIEALSMERQKKLCVKIINYEDPLKDVVSQDKITIESIEDSFRLMNNAIKSKGSIKVFDKHGHGVSLTIGL